MNPAVTAALCGLLLTAGGAARAEPITVFGRILNASVSAEVAPSYEGGKHYAPFPGGSLALSKPWEFDAFAATDDAASFGVVNQGPVEIGIAAALRENRDNKNELQGMRSIGWSLQGGGYMNVWVNRHTRIHIEALKGLTSQSGVVINTGADFVFHPPMWNLAVGPRYSWGDDRFNGTYFGVTRAEAQGSPFAIQPFHAGAGSHVTGVEAMAEYKWRPRWRITFDAGYERMLGADAKSPLVRQLGSVDQFSGGAGLRFVLQD